MGNLTSVGVPYYRPKTSLILRDPQKGSPNVGKSPYGETGKYLTLICGELPIRNLDRLAS